jgi:hypothetical protein
MMGKVEPKYNVINSDGIDRRGRASYDMRCFLNRRPEWPICAEDLHPALSKPGIVYPNWHIEIDRRNSEISLPFLAGPKDPDDRSHFDLVLLF